MLSSRGRVAALVMAAMLVTVCAPSQAGLIVDLSYNGYGGAVPITATGATTIAVKAIVSGTSTAAGSTGVQTVIGSLSLSSVSGAAGQAIDGNINLSWGTYGFNATGYSKGFASDIDADGYKEMIGSTISTRQSPGSTIGKPLVGFNASGMQTNAEGSNTVTVQMADLVLSAVNLGTGATVGAEKATTVKFVYQWSGSPTTEAATAAAWRMDGASQNGTGDVGVNNLTFYIPYATATTPTLNGYNVDASGAQSTFNTAQLTYYWTVNGQAYSDGLMTSGSTATLSGLSAGTYTIGFQTKAVDDGVTTWSSLVESSITIPGAPSGNNSQLSVATPASDGSSAYVVPSFGRVMLGSSQSTSVTLNKTGSNTTTYDVAVSGAGASSSAGTNISIGADGQTASINAGLVTTSTGNKSGQVVITNRAVDSGGTGLGSADGNDIITVSGTVLADRIVTASTVNYASNLLAGAHVSGSTTLTTTGADSEATRLTVATSGASGAFSVSGGTWPTFNSATATGTGTVAGKAAMGQMNGTVTLTASGEGLAGENDHNVTVNYVFGTAAGLATTNGTSFGTALTAGVGSGQSLADLASKTTAGGAVLGNQATILEGTASAAETVAMAWRTRTAYEASLGHEHGQMLSTDVVRVSIGDGSYVDHAQTDMYVLQLSYDPALLTEGTESFLASNGWLQLMYLDTRFAGDPRFSPEGKWRQATLGNFGGTATYRGVGVYDAGLDYVLGYYGVDTASHTVWAVVNYSGTFAVPEPATLSLLVLGGALIVARRRRSRA